MKDSDRILFTQEEFDKILDSLPKSPMDLAVIAHTILSGGGISVKDDQIYTIILKTCKHLLVTQKEQMRAAFPELFQ